MLNVVTIYGIAKTSALLVFVIGLFSITSFFNIMAISVDRLLAV